MEISLKDLSKVDFNSPELQAEFKAIEKRCEERIRMTIPDTTQMNKSFTI